jgi:hypothetical protein
MMTYQWKIEFMIVHVLIMRIVSVRKEIAPCPIVYPIVNAMEEIATCQAVFPIVHVEEAIVSCPIA